MNRKYDLLAFALALFAAAVISATAIFGPVLDDAKSKGIYDFVKEWQTLVAGAIAIIAALIAAHPVRKQLLKMNLQSAVMSRDVLSERLSDMEQRKERTRNFLSSLTDEYRQNVLFLSYDEDYGQDVISEINPHWVFNAQKAADSVVRKLNLAQESKVDTEKTDRSRYSVIQSIKILSQCLDAIHRPYSLDVSDPDYDFSEEDIAAIEAASEKAKNELPDTIDDVLKGSRDLDTAFEFEIQRLRKRIRLIDDRVISAELDD